MTNRKTGNQKRKYSFNRYEDIDKCIWKVFDTFGHDEKIENLVYWTKKLQKERATFRKKSIKYDELKSILEEYNVTPEILREVLLTGQMFRLQPAFFECVKEWNQKGWIVDIHKREITISDNRSLAEISIDRKDKAYWCSHYLSFELHYLLTKTIKALKVENGKEI